MTAIATKPPRWPFDDANLARACCVLVVTLQITLFAIRIFHWCRSD